MNAHYAAAPMPQILRLKEAAIYCRTSTDTLRRANVAGELKLFRLGLGRKRGPLGVRLEEIHRWLAAREAELNEEPHPRFKPC